jgi:site-specific recombinase XerC
MRKRNRKPPCRKIVLRLPDLDQAKSAVLNSLSSPSSRRNYKFAMEQFITWYCSEPRLTLNRAVVLRFRLHLESLGLAAGTVNQRLAAVKGLAYEAADSGLLSPELAAGICRVKGVKLLGARTGNWLTRDQASLLLEKAEGADLRSLRDVAMISVLLGCGLRRAELSSLEIEDMQIRQGHWAIVDLVGKSSHVRTVPMPNWVKRGGGSLDDRGQSHRWSDLSGDQPSRNVVRQRHLGECRIVCGSEMCRTDAVGSPGSA